MQDLFDPSILKQKVEGALAVKNPILVKIYNRRAIEVDAIRRGVAGDARCDNCGAILVP